MWGDESPPGTAGQPLIVYVKPGSWEAPATPPFLCRLSLPHSSTRAAPVAARLLLGPKQISQPLPGLEAEAEDGENGSASPALWQLPPPAGGLRVQRRKRGCEAQGCFPGAGGGLERWSRSARYCCMTRGV